MKHAVTAERSRGCRGGAALGGLAVAIMLGEAASVTALEISSAVSPWNRERPNRSHTCYIILHTTEAPAPSALRKVQANGEAHFFLDTRGHVYRIIYDKKLALHSGRSLWDGRSNIDDWSFGIEVTGYHNKDLTPAQYAALKELLEILQTSYQIPDENVLSHSMVAYGAPNRWIKKAHRGRKRCGMLFARKSVRRQLGLDRDPAFDPDVKNGSLVVGDPYLARVLYGDKEEQEKASVRYAAEDANVISTNRSAWDIAGDEYKDAAVRYVFPNGQSRRGDEVADWREVPVGTRVVFVEENRKDEAESVMEIGVDGETAVDVAGEEYNRKTTLYFFPDKTVKRGDELGDDEFRSLPRHTRVLVGYIHGGRITAKRSAFDICGKAWRYPSTYYRLLNGTLVPGSRIRESQIPRGTLIFFRK